VYILGSDGVKYVVKVCPSLVIVVVLGNTFAMVSVTTIGGSVVEGGMVE